MRKTIFHTLVFAAALAVAMPLSAIAQDAGNNGAAANNPYGPLANGAGVRSSGGAPVYVTGSAPINLNPGGYIAHPEQQQDPGTLNKQGLAPLYQTPATTSAQSYNQVQAQLRNRAGVNPRARSIPSPFSD